MEIFLTNLWNSTLSTFQTITPYAYIGLGWLIRNLVKNFEKKFDEHREDTIRLDSKVDGNHRQLIEKMDADSREVRGLINSLIQQRILM